MSKLLDTKQTFDFCTEWFENTYFQHYENPHFEGELILLYDLIHTADKYNHIMNLLTNYTEHKLQVMLTNGINCDIWNDYYTVIEFIKPEIVTKESKFPVVVNKPFVVHVDGKIIEGNIDGIYNEKNHKLVLLQISDDKYRFLEIPLDVNKEFNGVSFKQLLFDYKKFESTFSKEAGVLPNDPSDIKKYKLYSWVQKDLTFHNKEINNQIYKSKFLDYLNEQISFLNPKTVQQLVDQHIYDNEEEILDWIQHTFNTNSSCLPEIYIIDYCENIQLGKQIPPSRELSSLIFPVGQSGGFYYIGSKTNFDCYLLNNNSGIIYIFPMFITIFNVIELRIKEVIKNIDETVFERYVPKHFSFMVHFRLFESFKYRF